MSLATLSKEVDSFFTEMGITPEEMNALINNPDHFTQEEWDKISEDEIAKMKRQRIDRWADYMGNPPTPKELTKEEMQAVVVELENQKTEIEQKRIEIQAKIDVMLVVDVKSVDDVKPVDVLPVDVSRVEDVQVNAKIEAK